MDKICTDCGKGKPLTEFYQRTWKRTDNTRGSGTDSLCKSCRASHRYKYQNRLKDGDVYAVAGSLLSRMKDRTNKNTYNDVVEWTKEEIVDIISNGKCSKTGIPFDLTLRENSRNPFRPSPDRVDNAIGYTKDNTEWVVVIYNLMRNEFTDDDVALFIEHIKKE